MEYGKMDAVMSIERPKLICLYGPESVGKTTLGLRLAQEYQVPFVQEVARELVFDSHFTVEDSIKIGYAQTAAVQKATQTAAEAGHKFMICDTDVITTQLYAQIYLNEIPPILYELEKQVQYDHYFLFDIDVPWVADGLRDLGHRRQEIFTLFKNALDDRQIPYTLVSGDWKARWKTVTEEVGRSEE
jgi:HTH-type transcriptional regulator, transcriptional repressor of NAD biosynthesis genes